MVGISPPIFGLSDFSDFFKGVEFSSIYAGAFLSCSVPGGWAFQVVGPEGPGSALAGSNWVNCTFSAALDLSQEYAVFSARVFDDCCSQGQSL